MTTHHFRRETVNDVETSVARIDLPGLNTEISIHVKPGQWDLFVNRQHVASGVCEHKHGGERDALDLVTKALGEAWAKANQWLLDRQTRGA